MRRACTLKEVSNVGATLQVETSIEGLTLNEFFLLLSSTGLAYRRCQLERVNGDQLRVSFIREKRQGQKILRQELDPGFQDCQTFPGTFGLCALCNLQFTCARGKTMTEALPTVLLVEDDDAIQGIVEEALREGASSPPAPRPARRR